MLELFRKNHFLNSILLFFYALIIRLFSLINSKVWEGDHYGIGSAELFELLESQANWQSFLAIVLLFFQAAFINRLYITNRMQDENTLFPGVFYILLCSIFPEFLYLSPVLIANTFFIQALSSVFYSYKKVELSSYLLNAGIWIAVASVFYFPFIYFLPILFIAISILRILKLKDILQVISGVVVVYFLFFAVYYVNDNIAQFFTDQFRDNLSFINFHKKPTISEWLIIGFYGLIILWSILNYTKFILKKGLQAQKKINILYWVLLVSFFPIFFQNNLQIEYVMVLNIALAFFLGESFNFIKKRGIAEAIHLLLFFGAFILHFLYYT